MPLDVLARDLAASSHELTAAICRSAVPSMCYGPDALAERLEPLYFSLYNLAFRDEIVMPPHDFASCEGFVNMLRVIALRSPPVFLSEFTRPLSSFNQTVWQRRLDSSNN